MADTLREVEVGQTIFREGDASHDAYVVQSGRIEISKLTDEGVVLLGKLGPGDLLGEIGVLAECPRTASARALEASVLRVLDRDELLATLARADGRELPVVLKLVDKLREASELVTDEQARARLFRPRRRPHGWRGRLGAALARRRRGRDAVLDFMPEIVDLEERPAPAAAHVTLFAVGGLLAAAVTWSSLVSVDRVVTATGEITTRGRNIQIQPIELGVIREIAVAEGEVVRTGDVLATLDATFAEADVAANETLLASLDAEVTRLRAEIDGGEVARFSEVAHIDELQRALLTQRRAAYEAELAALEAELLELGAQRERNRADERALARQVEVVGELATMRRELLDRGAGSRAQYLETRSEQLRLEQQLTAIRHAEPELVQREAALVARREALESDRLARIAGELQEAVRHRDAVLEELRKAERRRGLIRLEAPAAGVVLDIADLAVGSVIREAEPLFTLVPLDVPLEVELDVAPRDIGRIRVGDPVRVKLEALPFQRHGTLDGVVRVISEDSFERETPSGPVAVYRVDVDLASTELRDVPDDFRLIPGMTARGEIKVGERRLISYVLYPIIRAADESFREP
jgi:HlyD family secretion protein